MSSTSTGTARETSPCVQSAICGRPRGTGLGSVTRPGVHGPAAAATEPRTAVHATVPALVQSVTATATSATAASGSTFLTRSLGDLVTAMPENNEEPKWWTEMKQRKCPACGGELNVDWSPDSIDFLCNDCGYGWFEKWSPDPA